MDHFPRFVVFFVAGRPGLAWGVFDSVMDSTEVAACPSKLWASQIAASLNANREN